MPNVTHQRQRLEVVVQDSALLELISRRMPEAASQTFKLNAPVKLSSGLVAEFVNPTDGLLAGYALADGQNATGKMTDIVLALAHVSIEANFLGAAAAANVLAAADMGLKFALAKDANLLGTGKPGWYILDSATENSHRISEFPPLRMANVDNAYTSAGDTDARVRATPILTKTQWMSDSHA